MKVLTQDLVECQFVGALNVERLPWGLPSGFRVFVGIYLLERFYVFQSEAIGLKVCSHDSILVQLGTGHKVQGGVGRQK